MKKRHRKKRIIFFGTLFIIVVIIFFFGGIIRKLTNKTVSITIPEGTSTVEIADILKENGVISSKSLFLLNLRLSEYSGKLQYGTFKLDTGDSMKEIIKTLATKGAKKNTVTLTVPEGYSIEKIKEKVCDLGICTDTEFEKALKKDYDYDFLKAIPKNTDVNYRLQGFLYPSTYEFYSDASAETVIDTMLAEFEKQIAKISADNDKLFETVIKASLIEREAKIDSERSIIAGVINNRLNIDMPLQIDATVAYVISNGLYNADRVYYKDLQNNSLYNTYKYKGLPAGPICSPGINSLKAALSPSQHNYLYYHTDTKKNDGSHIFTETYEEHTSTQNN